MAYVHSELRDKVGRRIRDTAYSSDEITDYLNNTLNDIYNEYKLPMMQTSIVYTVPISTPDITNAAGLPDDYVQAYTLTVTATGKEQVIPYIDWQELNDLYPDAVDTVTHPNSASPLYWSIYNDTIRVFPAPSVAYSVELRYYRKPTLLVNDSDVPDLPSQFEEALVLGASYRVQQVKDNYDQAAIFQNKYDEILDKLVLRYSQPQVGKPRIIRSNRRHVGKTSF